MITTSVSDLIVINRSVKQRLLLLLGGFRGERLIYCLLCERASFMFGVEHYA